MKLELTEQNINRILGMHPIKHYKKWFCEVYGQIEDLQQMIAIMILEINFETNNELYMRKHIAFKITNKIRNILKKETKMQLIEFEELKELIIKKEQLEITNPFTLVSINNRQIVMDFYYMRKRKMSHNKVQWQSDKLIIMKKYGYKSFRKFVENIKDIIDQIKYELGER